MSRGGPILVRLHGRIQQAIDGWMPMVERVLATFRTWGPRRSFVVIASGAGVLMLLWSALAPVDIIVRAEGRLIPAGKAQIVQHLEGGIVRRLLVSEGEAVSAGQPLMELSDIRARSDLGQERSRLDALRGREARLEAEADGKGEIVFPADLKDPEVRRAEADAFHARNRRLQEELGVLRNQNAQKRSEIRETELRRQNQAAELEVVRRQAGVLEGLRAKGAASQLEVLEAQGRVQRLISQLSESDASLPRLRSAVAETESKLQEAGARFRAEALAELTQIRADVEKVNHEIEAGADRLDRSIVKAPVAGYINKLNINTVGGVVRPGDGVLEITPADNRVVMEGKVRPNDRASLRAGLPARIRLGAFDYATYGVLDGRVGEVSADTLTDERGERYYRVRVDATVAGSMNPLPGMTAQADVIVGQRTVLSYVVSPLLRFRDSAFRDPR